MLGLHFCARAFPSCCRRGPLFIAVRGPLTVMASLVAEHRLQTRRLSSCGSRAQLLRGMWDPPRPGLEPASPALAGRFSTTVPPGKPTPCCFLVMIIMLVLLIMVRTYKAVKNAFGIFYRGVHLILTTALQFRVFILPRISQCVPVCPKFLLSLSNSTFLLPSLSSEINTSPNITRIDSLSYTGTEPQVYTYL